MKKNILFSSFNVQRCQILYSASPFIWGHKESPLWAVALFPILNSAGLNLTTKHTRFSPLIILYIEFL